MTRLALSVVLLALVYAFTLASLDPWDLVIGALVASGLLWLFRQVTIGHRPAPLPDLPTRVIRFVPFAARIAMDVVMGTWDVAQFVLGLGPRRAPGIVSIPLLDRSHRGVAVTALVTTLAPGSYFLRVDWERRVMFFHFVDASDPDTVRGHMASFYERYQRHVFP